VRFGSLDPITGTEGPQIGGGTFGLHHVPPYCPAFAPPGHALGLPGHAPQPGIGGRPGSRLSFQSEFFLCKILESRKFHVVDGGVEVRLVARSVDDRGKDVIQPDCPRKYYVALTRSLDYWPDFAVSTKEVELDRATTLKWEGLRELDYYLVIRPQESIFETLLHPGCCLQGDLYVSTYPGHHRKRPHGLPEYA